MLKLTGMVSSSCQGSSPTVSRRPPANRTITRSQRHTSVTAAQREHTGRRGELVVGGGPPPLRRSDPAGSNLPLLAQRRRRGANPLEGAGIILAEVVELLE